MRVALGCDHAGLPLKDQIASKIRSLGHRVIDVGAFRKLPQDDYPDYAERLASAIRRGRAARGILLCGSGVGAAIAANKFKGIRAALAENTFSARQGVEDDDANVLCLGARVTGPSLALELVSTFLRATFSRAPRHRRRVQKIKAIEQRENR